MIAKIDRVPQLFLGEIFLGAIQTVKLHLTCAIGSTCAEILVKYVLLLLSKKGAVATPLGRRYTIFWNWVVVHDIIDMERVAK